jgi:hypothetical protein
MEVSEMRSIFKEYKRLKKLAQITEGKLGQETIQAFLDKVDEQALERLKVSAKDMDKLKKSAPEAQLKILTPYFDKSFQQAIEAKTGQKSQMSEKITRIIAGSLEVQ